MQCGECGTPHNVSPRKHLWLSENQWIELTEWTALCAKCERNLAKEYREKIERAKREHREEISSHDLAKEVHADLLWRGAE